MKYAIEPWFPGQDYSETVAVNAGRFQVRVPRFRSLLFGPAGFRSISIVSACHVVYDSIGFQTMHGHS